MKVIDGFLLGVSLLSAKRFRAFHKFHVDRHFHLEHIHAVPVFRKLAHALGDDVRLPFRIVQALFVRAFLIADEFKEIWDVVGAANVAKQRGIAPGSIGVIGWSLGAASALMATQQTGDIGDSLVIQELGQGFQSLQAGLEVV